MLRCRLVLRLTIWLLRGWLPVLLVHRLLSVLLRRRLSILLRRRLLLAVLLRRILAILAALSLRLSLRGVLMISRSRRRCALVVVIIRRLSWRSARRTGSGMTLEVALVPLRWSLPISVGLLVIHFVLRRVLVPNVSWQ